jgi:uncharacterized membrane protein YkvA (DUF1232 family)
MKDASLGTMSSNTNTGLDLPRRRRGFSIVPFFGDLLAMGRMVWDRRSPLWAKLLAIAAILYVVIPVDAVPDVALLLGWLDDVGVVLALRVALHRRLEAYRYPLFESPAPRPPEPGLLAFPHEAAEAHDRRAHHR